MICLCRATAGQHRPALSQAVTAHSLCLQTLEWLVQCRNSDFCYRLQHFKQPVCVLNESWRGKAKLVPVLQLIHSALLWQTSRAGRQTFEVQPVNQIINLLEIRCRPTDCLYKPHTTAFVGYVPTNYAVCYIMYKHTNIMWFLHSITLTNIQSPD